MCDFVGPRVKSVNVSIRQSLKWTPYEVAVVELNVAFFVEGFKPRGGRRSQNQDIINFVAIFVWSAWVAHLVSIHQSSVLMASGISVEIWLVELR